MRVKSLVSLIACFMICALSVTAQQEQNDQNKKIVIIEKSIDENGEESTQTIRLEGAEAEEYLKNNDNINIDLDEGSGNVEVRVQSEGEGSSTVWISNDGEETVIDLGGEHEFHVIEDGEGTDVNIIRIGDDFEKVKEDMNIFIHSDDDGKTTKKIVIKTDGGSDEDLLKEFGLEDIDTEDIQNININQNNGTRTLELKLKNGKKIKKVIEGGDKDMGMFFMNDREHRFMRGGSFPCDDDRPFLGISMKDIHPVSSEEELVDKATNGVEVINVTKNSGAAAAGLSTGDVITAIDGKTILTNSDISQVIKSHKIGDVIDITLNRGSQTLTMPATLGKRECRDWSMKDHHKKWDKHKFQRNYKRDPCKPLIGFFHRSSHDGDGIAVSQVIDDTPADRQNLQAGDVVVSFDGQDINSWNHLIEMRDAHEAGDRFKMVILRDGKKQKIKANFNDCPKEEEVENPEIFEYDLPENIVVDGQAIDFTVYPNPSQGQVTVEYRGTAAPLSIQISDIAGKILINRNIEDFDGNFKQEFDFSDAAEGTILVRIQQGEDVVVRQIVLQKSN